MKKVWNKKSQAWVYVPEHWLGHPVLGRDFTLAPPKESGKVEGGKKNA